MPRSTSLAFKSDWFTNAEEDGSWYLTYDHKVSTHILFPVPTAAKGLSFLPPLANSRLQYANMTIDARQFNAAKKLREEEAFQHVLCSMFNRPYAVTSSVVLLSMATLADYYGCLPNLSRTISESVLNSPGLIKGMKDDPCSVLQASQKLRNGVLFQDALIYTLGPWSAPRYEKLSDPGLRAVVERESHRIKALVGEVYRGIVRFQLKESYNTKPATEMLNSLKTAFPNGRLRDPELVRFCSQELGNIEVIGKAVLLLLQNKLLLDRDAVAGKGEFEDFFLCGNIKNSDLPWDQNQNDF